MEISWILKQKSFNTQGFPESYKLPQLTDSKLYKQAGNSVCVSVIERIAEKIKLAVEKTDGAETDRSISRNKIADYMKALPEEDKRVIEKMLKEIK